MSSTFLVMRYLGVPYKHMGRDLNGLDCWGLIKLVYKESLNTELWDLEEGYPEDWGWAGRDLFMANYRKQWEKVKVPQAFDVVLIKNSKGIADHAGVALNDKAFIHCLKAGVVVSKFREKFWKDRIAGYFRYKR